MARGRGNKSRRKAPASAADALQAVHPARQTRAQARHLSAALAEHAPNVLPEHLPRDRPSTSAEGARRAVNIPPVAAGNANRNIPAAEGRCPGENANRNIPAAEGRCPGDNVNVAHGNGGIAQQPGDVNMGNGGEREAEDDISAINDYVVPARQQQVPRLVEANVRGNGGELNTNYSRNGELNNNFLANARQAPTGYDAREFENAHSQNSMLIQQNDNLYSPLTSLCSPLGEGLSYQIKDKIAKGEYVEFASLLDKGGRFGRNQ